LVSGLGGDGTGFARTEMIRSPIYPIRAPVATTTSPMFDGAETRSTRKYLK
jgi:hypothetical protein